jgi:hypothetical protein
VEIEELIQLGGLLQKVNLVAGQTDDISWRWTANGQYSAKSAYLAEVQGSNALIEFTPLGSAFAEPKHHFFGWLILHQRTLTAENLLRRHWPCDWICSLCNSAFEDAAHLAKRMPFHSDHVDADLYLDEFSAASTSFARKSIGLVEQFLHYFAKTKQEQGSGSSHHNMVERLARAKQKKFSTDFKE